MDEIILKVKRRLESKITDQDAWRKGVQLSPASASDLAADEALLGFRLPPLLKRLYFEIGNGGFGPGYGLIGMTSGVPDDTAMTSPQIYHQLRSDDTTDPGWAWPEFLLPICHWGCAINSCIACNEPGFPMRVFDPNVHDHDASWSDAFFDEGMGFEEWIKVWAEGGDLWQRMYGDNGTIALMLAQRKER